MPLILPEPGEAPEKTVVAHTRSVTKVPLALPWPRPTIHLPAKPREVRQPKTTINHTSFPEIIDMIIESADRQSLKYLQQTCFAFYQKVFKRCSHHVLLWPQVIYESRVVALDAFGTPIWTCGLFEGNRLRFAHRNPDDTLDIRPVTVVDTFLPKITGSLLPFPTFALDKLPSILDFFEIMLLDLQPSTLRCDWRYVYCFGLQLLEQSLVVREVVYFGGANLRPPLHFFEMAHSVPQVNEVVVINVVVESTPWLVTEEYNFCRILAPRLVVILGTKPGLPDSWDNTQGYPNTPLDDALLRDLRVLSHQYEEIVIVGLERLLGEWITSLINFALWNVCYFVNPPDVPIDVSAMMDANLFRHLWPTLEVEMFAELLSSKKRTAREGTRLLVRLGMFMRIMSFADDWVDQPHYDGLLDKLSILTCDEYRAEVGDECYRLHTRKRHVYLGPLR